MNPRAAIAPLVSKRKAMLATTTRLINRIWGEYYLNSLPEDSKESSNCEIKEAAEEEEDVDHEEYGEEDSEDFEEKKMDCPHSMLKMKESGSSSNNDVRWDGEAMGQTPSGEAIYQRAIVCGESVNVGGFVLVDKEGFNEFSHICLVEYMYENSKGEIFFHGRLMMRGYQTILGNTADDRELFLNNDCQEFEVNDFVENLVVETRIEGLGSSASKG
jgi:DNA (cytosine-5)-methyltransferase 1